jgi:hypothetical protein
MLLLLPVAALNESVRQSLERQHADQESERVAAFLGPGAPGERIAASNVLSPVGYALSACPQLLL